LALALIEGVPVRGWQKVHDKLERQKSLGSTRKTVADESSLQTKKYLLQKTLNSTVEIENSKDRKRASSSFSDGFGGECHPRALLHFREPGVKTRAINYQSDILKTDSEAFCLSLGTIVRKNGRDEQKNPGEHVSAEGTCSTHERLQFQPYRTFDIVFEIRKRRPVAVTSRKRSSDGVRTPFR